MTTRSNFWFKCLAQEHFDIYRGGPRIQTQGNKTTSQPLSHGPSGQFTSFFGWRWRGSLVGSTWRPNKVFQSGSGGSFAPNIIFIMVIYFKLLNYSFLHAVMLCLNSLLWNHECCLLWGKAERYHLACYQCTVQNSSIYDVKGVSLWTQHG